MYFAKTMLRKGEIIKAYLVKNNLLNQDYHTEKDKTALYYPLKRKAKLPKYAELVEKNPRKKSRITTLRQALKTKLTKEEFGGLKTAYDLVGETAILEIPGELEKKEKLIADTLLKINKNIKTVLKKSGIHEGEFRTQKLKFLAGKNTKVAEYRENNVRLKLDLEKVYFSARSSTERKRISKLIKQDENILVMFSGCAPYPVVISKNTRAKHITGIEINPVAHKFAMENVKLNKLKNIKLINADVITAMPKEKFDRILMPLPKSAGDFLDLALRSIKDKGMIHFYEFLRSDEIPDAVKKIETACKKENKTCKLRRITRCGQFSPYVFRVCIDIRLT